MSTSARLVRATSTNYVVEQPPEWEERTLRRKFKFTVPSIAALPHIGVGEPLDLRDSEVRGLYLRLGKQSKTFLVKGFLFNKAVERKVGRTDRFSPEEARRKARKPTGRRAQSKAEDIV